MVVTSRSDGMEPIRSRISAPADGTMRMRALAFIVLTVSLPGLSPAWGQDCHSRAIHAKGGYGLIEASAKSRARSAWIKKVRSKRRLGRDYAAWLRARQASYACHRAGKRIACIASAIPCRVDVASPK